ncbi:MAG: carbohydrate kinase family protein [Acidilobus sp.]
MPGIALVGLSVCDFVMSVDRLASPSDIIYLEGGLKLSTGGHPINIAIDLMKLGTLGTPVSVITAVGKDMCGSFIVGELSGRGVNTQYIQVVDGSETGKDFIISLKGEDRRFHVELGANRLLSPEHVINSIKSLKPEVIHIAIGALSDVDEQLSEILGVAKEQGSITFVDIGVAARPSGGWDFLYDVLKNGLVDVFHANAYEILKVFGMNSDELVLTLVRSNLRVALITEGDKGASLTTNEFTVRQPPFTVDVVDPTGAGDAFQAGFLSYLITRYADVAKGLNSIEKDPEAASLALAYSQATGAACVRAPGATEGVTKSNVEMILRSQLNDILSRTIVIKIRNQ